MALATLETLYSTANGLRIRSLPSTLPESAVVGKLSRGDVVKVVFGGVKDVQVGGKVWEVPTPWIIEEGDANIGLGDTKGVTWVYVSQPKKGWAALKVNNKTYLQDTPPKAGTPAEALPDIDPTPFIPPTKIKQGGTFPILALVALGAIAAWWWDKSRGK